MDRWLIVPIAVIGFIVIFTLILWVTRLLQYRKSAKYFNLDIYLACYWLGKFEDSKNEIIIFDGILGINTNELVYVNHFQDDAMCMKLQLSTVAQLDVSYYDEKEFLNFVYSDIDENDKIKYIIRNMAGYSFTKRIPKFIKARMLCKIGFSDGGEMYFCYKNTPQNVEIMDMMKSKCISYKHERG